MWIVVYVVDEPGLELRRAVGPFDTMGAADAWMGLHDRLLSSNGREMFSVTMQLTAPERFDDVR